MRVLIPVVALCAGGRTALAQEDYLYCSIFHEQPVMTMFHGEVFHGDQRVAHEARRDAMLLSPEAWPQPDNVVDLGRVIGMLSPDAVEFGRTPRSAIAQAMEMARFVVDGRKNCKNCDTRQQE